MSKKVLPDLPSLVNERVTTYKRLWRIFVFIHYTVGIIGLCASILASAIEAPWNRIFAVVAAVCFGIIALVKPEQKYYKYVRAWRLLENGTIKYRLGFESQKGLMRKIDQAESILYEFEEKRIQAGTDEK